MSDINQDDYDSFGNYVDALQAAITELEADSVHGWRSCIDHIIKPESDCPVCKIESLQATIEDLEAEVLALRGSFNMAQEEVALLQATITELHGDNLVLATGKADLQATITSLKRRPSVATHNALQEECDGRMVAIKKLQATITELTAQKAKTRIQYQMEVDKVIDLRATITEFEERILRSTVRRNELIDENGELQATITEKDDHNFKLSETLVKHLTTITEQADKINELFMVLDNIRQKTDFLPFTPESTYSRAALKEDDHER